MSSQYFRFTAGAAQPQRSQLLERLIARADRCSAVANWRSEAFQLIAPEVPVMPAVAAAVLCADHGAMETPWVCLATPLHYIAEMNGVRLAPEGTPSLTAAEAGALAADYNRVLGGEGLRLTATRSGLLLGLFEQALQVATHDPLEVRGLPIEEFLPTGKDSARVRRLMSEAEMWLFEHSSNKVRSESGLTVLNGLWFWGGGAALRALPRLAGWTAGDDVFFNAFGAANAGPDANGVIAVDAAPGSDAWLEVEARWLKPAAEKLKAGKLSQLKISALNRCFTVSARRLQRFWRRSRSWQESFG